MSRRSPIAGIKGCGKKRVALTFYRVRVRPQPLEGLESLACGQQAVTTDGRSGMLLCEACAKVNRIVVSGRLVLRLNRRGERKRLYRL